MSQTKTRAAENTTRLRSLRHGWIPSSRHLRSGAQVLAIIGAEALLLYWVNRFYPLEHWLFFLYAQTWLWMSLFALSALLSGVALLRAVAGKNWRTSEELVLGGGLGVLLFYTGTMLAGLLSLFGPVFAVVWPLCLIAIGSRDGLRLAKRAKRAWRRFGGRLVAPRGPIEIAAFALLVLSLVGIYLQVLNPLNPAADAHWYHLGIADQYVAAGGVTRFKEGWYLGAYPQLATILYTWALLLPTIGGHFVQMAVASHLEWCLLLWTLFGVTVLIRRLLRAGRYPYACAALFLFPGIFLYDSSLGTAADHVLAFWAPTIALSCLRLSRSHDFRSASVLGLLLAGAMLTKLQALYFVPCVTLTIVVLAIRHRSILPMVTSAGVFLVALSTHWLKNLIWYGDPYYPLLRRWFPSHPLHEGASALLEEVFWYDRFMLTGTPRENTVATLSALVNFSFIPNNWESFHRNVPVFGFLFTLLLPALLFTKGTRRAWYLVLATHLGIVAWYVTSHQDRYLQALLPWMAAVVSAGLVLLWRQGALQKISAFVLVCTQLVWGSDVYFLRTHGMIGGSPLKSTTDFISSGFYANKNEALYEQRLRTWGGLQDVGKEIPKGSVVLLHDLQERMSLGHVAIKDELGWQGLISYPHLGSAEGALAQLKELGVTHIVWRASRPGLPRRQFASEAVFAEMMNRYTGPAKQVSTYFVSELLPPSAPTAAGSDSRILVLSCAPEPRSGLYTPIQLHDRKAPSEALPEKASAKQLQQALDKASSVILYTGCPDSNQSSRFVRKRFREHGRIKDTAVFVPK